MTIYRGIPRPATSGGLTLVELVLGIALTAIIAGAIATMLFAVSKVTSDEGEARSLMVGHSIAASRIGAAVRNARNLLAAEDGYLVLWDERENSDGVPQLSELQRIELDADTRTLWSYQAPPDLPDSLDPSFDLATTDFNAVTRALEGTATFPGRLWGIGVATWTVCRNGSDCLDATYVGYRLTLGTADASETTVGGAALRNR